MAGQCCRVMKSREVRKHPLLLVKIVALKQPPNLGQSHLVGESAKWWGNGLADSFLYCTSATIKLDYFMQLLMQNYSMEILENKRKVQGN